MYPLSVGLLMIFVMCSMPIRVALSSIGAYPSPIPLVGLCIASVGKLGIRPSAFLAALLRILSTCYNYLSVKMPRGVAWYFDLSSCSITSFLRLGDSSLFAGAMANFLMYVVMCLRRSRKSSMGLICTPSIL